jgi:copper resistance protein B
MSAPRRRVALAFVAAAVISQAVVAQDAAPPPVDHSKMDHSKMDHSGMNHSATGHEGMAPPQEPEKPAAHAPLPAVSAADRAAAFPDLAPHSMSDDAIHSTTVFNRLETSQADQRRNLHWEARTWIGTDTRRVWLRSEGERARGRTRAADLEALYGRSLSPWWDVVVGVRESVGAGPSQTWAAIGVMGTAPQKIDVAATWYIGGQGRSAARLEAERELLLSNRLILQPRLELEFADRADPVRGIGAGLGKADLGLRLRYEITRQFAPYVGVARERAFGRTAEWRERDSEPQAGWSVVAGVRVWF